MHEESLIRSLLRQVEDLASRHQAVAIEEIDVEVGPLSGVEPMLVQSAFERLKTTTSCRAASLTIHLVELEVVCRDCHTESQLQNFRFVCLQCGSTSLQVLRGDTCQLLNVKMQVHDSLSAYAV